MQKVRKAVITAAGRGTRQYPASSTVQKEMFPLVDRDGLTKPTIQIIAEEALASGIEASAATAPTAAEHAAQRAEQQCGLHSICHDVILLLWRS